MGVYLRGAVWYLRYRDAQGRMHRPATTARTMAEAKRLLAQVEAKVERQLLGLEPAPVQSSSGLALWDLCSWWLDKKCPPKGRKVERARLEKHVQRTELAALPLSLDLASVTDAVASYLDKLEEAGVEPGTLNRLRTSLHSVFSAAKKPPKRWTGGNPIADVPRRDVVKKKTGTLLSEEVEPFLAQVPAAWLGFQATGVFLALRKGEVCGLLKASVDLPAGVVDVANSYLNTTTKGGGTDTLPIPDALVPYFRDALKTPGPWMFPNLKTDPTGRTMLNEDANPEKITRTALKRAGLVTGYVHSCRRCGHARRPRGGGDPVASKFEPHTETHPDDAPRRCPQCAMKLWPEGLPRFKRFHDLRHSLVTILMRRGVPMQHIQRIARHADIKVTLDTYGHLVVEDLREAIQMSPRRGTGEAQLAVVQENEAQTKHNEPEGVNRAGGSK